MPKVITISKLLNRSTCNHYIIYIYHCIIVISFAVPPNGLVIYCGTIVTEEGKEKKVNIDFEPFKPINTSLYLCDNKVNNFLIHSALSNYETRIVFSSTQKP